MTREKSYSPPNKKIQPGLKPKMKFTDKGTVSDKNKVDPSIEAILSLVSESNIRDWLQKITSFHTRHSKSEFINEVATWLKNELAKMGLRDVRYHEYTESGYDLKNVVCNLNGESEKIILVCAHYDSRMENLEDAISRAPGADDNASGMAIVLEIANIISKFRFEKTIQLASFSGEEQGLWGSKHYAKFIKDNNISLHRLINLDMVGFHADENQVCIVERDIGNTHSTNDEHSELLAKNIEENARAYTNVTTLPGPIYDSDYMPFEELGYVVVGGYDGGAEKNPHYHSSKDEIVDIDINFVSNATKIILATLLQEAKMLDNV